MPHVCELKSRTLRASLPWKATQVRTSPFHQTWEAALAARLSSTRADGYFGFNNLGATWGCPDPDPPIYFFGLPLVDEAREWVLAHFFYCLDFFQNFGGLG